MTDAYYRTSDAAIMVRYEANLAAREQNTAATFAFYDRHGISRDEQIYGSRLFDGRSTFQGVTWPKDKPVPEHWRLVTKGVRRIEPKRTTKPGKAIDAEMRKLTRPSAKQNLGMPDMVHSPMDPATGTSHSYWFGLTRQSNTLWVRWGFDPDESDWPVTIDPRWEKVKLSEYYAIVEAGNDPFGDPS